MTDGKNKLILQADNKTSTKHLRRLLKQLCDNSLSYIHLYFDILSVSVHYCFIWCMTQAALNHVMMPWLVKTVTWRVTVSRFTCAVQAHEYTKPIMSVTWNSSLIFLWFQTHHRDRITRRHTERKAHIQNLKTRRSSKTH